MAKRVSLLKREKPAWAQMEQGARNLVRVARSLSEVALEMRCTAEESGGIQCTADAFPPHAHRWSREDLP
jgi:hypothetical protein